MIVLPLADWVILGALVFVILGAVLYARRHPK